MGYSANESMVRMDLFKSTTKWSQTYAVDMNDYYNWPDIKGAVQFAFEKSTGMKVTDGWMLVCLEPYHRHAHPIMVRG